MKLNDASKQLYFSVVQIVTTGANGQTSSGTGFYYSYETGPDEHIPLLITNKHVVAGAITGKFTFPAGDENGPLLGDHVEISRSNFESQWIPHPNPQIDLAAFLLAPIWKQLTESSTKKTQLCLIPITKALTATESDLEEMSGIEDVVFIGFPNGIWDSKNGLPVVRRGVTASPAEIDFEGRPQFLIDASVFGGSSGSPLFSYKSGAYLKNGSLMSGPTVRFIGVVTAVFFKTDTNGVRQLPVPTLHNQVVDNREMLDLGVITKARCVSELCDHIARTFGLDHHI